MGMDFNDDKSMKKQAGAGVESEGKKNNKVFVAMVCVAVALVAILIAIIIAPIGKAGEDEPGISNNVAGEATTGATAETPADDADNSTSANETVISTEAVTETQTLKVADTVAPVISGVKDRTFNIGDTVMYSSGVAATDDVDGAVEVTVDKSAVNAKKAGSYKVVYTATDKAGNKATAEATFTFKAVVADGASYKELATQLLSQIVDSSMSDGKKLQTIYDYIYGKLYYGDRRIAGSTWQEESVVALKELITSGSSRGDCFTSAAVSMALLEAMGAQVKWMDNTSEPNHVWALCNIGTGWYHFDTTRYVKGGKRFMCTDAQLAVWEAQTGFKRYEWDKAACPATATENFTY